MTDFCEICLTEAVSLDDWFLKTEPAHGKIAIISCVCPWCVIELQNIRQKIEENTKTLNEAEDIEFARNTGLIDILSENAILKRFVKVE